MKRFLLVIAALLMASTAAMAEDCKEAIKKLDHRLSVSHALETKKEDVRKERNAGEKELKAGKEAACKSHLQKAKEIMDKLDPL
jgi:Skp family chaperone for outer membrane proteins